MVVECYDTLSPVELNHHESVKIGVVLGSRQIVVCLHQSVSGWVGSGEEVAHLRRGVVVNVAEGFDIRQPIDVVAVVVEPNGSMEGHFVILYESKSTISSIDLESLEKILSKTRVKSYCFDYNSS